VHRIGLVDQAEHRDRLVGADHQLEPRPLGGDQAPARRRETEPARSERRVVRFGGHLAGKPEPGGPVTAPPQRGLTARAVVVQGAARMVVLPAEHGGLVVGDLVEAHAPEPRHDQVPALLPQPQVAIVFAIVGGCRTGCGALGSDCR
jgi:hypothetical protein